MKNDAYEQRRIRLSEANVGLEYRVVDVVTDGYVKKRILDMGLLPGSIVKIVRTAPLGDPLEILVKGFPLTIRRSEAKCILVEEVTS